MKNILMAALVMTSVLAGSVQAGVLDDINKKINEPPKCTSGCGAIIGVRG